MDVGQNPLVQVVPEAALQAMEQKQATDATAAQQPTQDMSQLASYIRGQFEIMRNHRNTAAGWSDRLLESFRMFNGQYSPTKLRDITQSGGSTIYARVAAQKCRAATSLLRDIYLGPDRPWTLAPPSDPPLAPGVLEKIDQLLEQESEMMQQAQEQASMGPPDPMTGQPPQPPPPPDPQDIMNRRTALVDQARTAALRKAVEQCRDSEDKVEQILRDGGFYHALGELLVDLPIFQIACIKGPIVRVKPHITWPPGGGQPQVEMTPMLCWERVSPFDLWWSPGASDIAQADIIEKLRVTRAELNDLLDLPGYNHDEILAVLDEYGRGGLYDNWDTTDAERSVLESRENPAWNRSAMLSMMAYTGNVQGRLLQEYGLAVPEELRDYHIEAWLIGSHVIKAHLSPSPRQRHPYFVTSFEKLPGTPVGNGLTDLLADMQEAANASLRDLINNMAMASGPQVVVHDDRIDPSDNTEKIHPWKIWHVRGDQLGIAGSGAPVEFFSPTSNAQELMQCYQQFVSIADDVSAIPKYVGGQASGGAGRTASGLAMLMGNASKILQSVSANIDRDIMEVALQQLLDLILLTDDSGLLTGEEKISVRGVQVAMQRETQRQRQMEFLQGTNNPVDQNIIGLKGRGVLLRNIAADIVPGETIVPDDDTLEQMQQQEMAAKANKPVTESVEKGVQGGVEAGVKRITADLVAGGVAGQTGVPLGPPVHEGVSPSAPGSASPAAQAQGNQPGQLSTNDTGPQTRTVGSPQQSPMGGNGPPIRGGV